MLTTADFDNMHRSEAWLGFGYIGGRRNHLDDGGSRPMVDVADAKAIAEANRLHLSYVELFEWANSKNGRWYADCMFGSNGSHAERYLPGQPQR